MQQLLQDRFIIRLKTNPIIPCRTAIKRKTKTKKKKSKTRKKTKKFNKKKNLRNSIDSTARWRWTRRKEVLDVATRARRRSIIITSISRRRSSLSLPSTRVHGMDLLVLSGFFSFFCFYLFICRFRFPLSLCDWMDLLWVGYLIWWWI